MLPTWAMRHAPTRLVHTVRIAEHEVVAPLRGNTFFGTRNADGLQGSLRETARRARLGSDGHTPGACEWAPAAAAHRGSGVDRERTCERAASPHSRKSRGAKCARRLRAA